MKLNLIVLVVMAFAVISCNKKTETPQPETVNEEMVDMHTSEIALDWDGTYSGTLPCADCEGIKTELTLNSDKTFELTHEYLGKRDVAVDTLRGNFSWAADGNNIELEGLKPGEASPFYKVEENRIRHLDMEGNPITGPLAENYVLSKK
ncbi:MAG TPA: copper resistance protein NlpE [Moheibacter sp.]|nr:copper resistance protein NlpE [Moheibacter sp.]